ncbi:MAG: hypothetical protein ACREBD_20080 [Blastocatellia bacterium]
MVLAAYGKRITEKRLRKLCNCQPGLGTHCSDVVNAARSLGFAQSVETYQLRLHDLRDLIRSGVFPMWESISTSCEVSGRHTRRW